MVSVPALINCAVIRTELPALRTEPSSTLRHVQRARDLRDLDLLALERERRGARRHLQLRNLRQQVQQFLRDAVGEVFLVLACDMSANGKTAMDAGGTSGSP